MRFPWLAGVSFPVRGELSMAYRLHTAEIQIENKKIDSSIAISVK